MNIFQGLISMCKKSVAAVIVQNLLEIQTKAGHFNGDPASTANKYVEAAWNSKLDVFNGEFYQRPYKLSVAAQAFAIAAVRLEKSNDPNLFAIVMSLNTILAEIQVNGAYYPLASIDHKLIEEALQMFSPISDRMNRRI